jgi:hypothetical protein
MGFRKLIAGIKLQNCDVTLPAGDEAQGLAIVRRGKANMNLCARLGQSCDLEKLLDAPGAVEDVTVIRKTSDIGDRTIWMRNEPVLLHQDKVVLPSPKSGYSILA